MEEKKEFFRYIEKYTGWQIIDKELHVNLPLYIKSGYELWNTSLEGFGVLFAKVKTKKIDMRMHFNAIKKIEEVCPCHVVLVFDSLDMRTMSGLIKKHIPFVVKEQYIYMPFALMQVHTVKVELKPQKKYKILTPDADVILIGYLNNYIHTGMMIKEISQITRREMRATSTALSVLESLGFVEIVKEGRSKRAYFINKQEVFDRLKREGKSPVKYFVYTDRIPNDYQILYSGYSAISRMTSLMDESLTSIAMSEKEYKKYENELECEKEDSLYKVEVWDRDPSIFSIEKSVNPLYLFRLFEDVEDERTEYALEELENKFLNTKVANR